MYQHEQKYIDKRQSIQHRTWDNKTTKQDSNTILHIVFDYIVCINKTMFWHKQYPNNLHRENVLRHQQYITYLILKGAHQTEVK